MSCQQLDLYHHIYSVYIVVPFPLFLSLSLPFCTIRSLHVLTLSTISSATQESLYKEKKCNGSHWSIECNGNIIVSCSCDEIEKVWQFPHMSEAQVKWKFISQRPLHSIDKWILHFVSLFFFVLVSSWENGY